MLQMVEQLPNVTQFFAAQLPAVAEPVIEVPKILLDTVRQRIVERRPPQMAGQLVEVPTILSFISLQQQDAEQIVDILLPRGHGDRGGLQGSLPRQNSAALFPWNRTVDIPTGGGLQDFLPDPGASSSSAVSRDERVRFFFCTFSQVKKVQNPPGVRVRSCSGRSHGLRRLMAVTTPGSWSCPTMRSSTFGTVTLG